MPYSVLGNVYMRLPAGFSHRIRGNLQSVSLWIMNESADDVLVSSYPSVQGADRCVGCFTDGFRTDEFGFHGMKGDETKNPPVEGRVEVRVLEHHRAASPPLRAAAAAAAMAAKRITDVSCSRKSFRSSIKMGLSSAKDCRFRRCTQFFQTRRA